MKIKHQKTRLKSRWQKWLAELNRAPPKKHIINDDVFDLIRSIKVKGKKKWPKQVEKD